MTRSFVFAAILMISAASFARLRFHPTEAPVPLALTSSAPETLAVTPIDLPPIEIPTPEPTPAPTPVPLVLGRWPVGLTWQSPTIHAFYTENLFIREVQHADYQLVAIIGQIRISDESMIARAMAALVRNKHTIITFSLAGGNDRTTTTLRNGFRSVCPKASCVLETHLEQSYKCASNCITLYMIGDVRMASPTAQFGFHSSSEGVPAVIHLNHVEQVYAKAGVDDLWILKNKWLFRKLDITWLTPSEMEGSNIVTVVYPKPVPVLQEQTVGQEAPTAQATAQSNGQSNAQLQTVPLMIAPYVPATLPVDEIVVTAPRVPSK